VGTLAQEYDCLLLDLDGTVFRGHELTEGAAESLEKAEGRKLFVTNNAARSADEVAGYLHDLGLDATADDVVTSAQSAARVLAAQLAPESRVLVVGTESLAAEIAAVGLRPVRLFHDEPHAVVQGHSPETGWTNLAEAALAIRAVGRSAGTVVEEVRRQFREHPGSMDYTETPEYGRVISICTAAAQRAQLQGAADLFTAGSYADAQTQFQKFADEYPNSPLTATAELGLASTLEALGKNDAALDAYKKTIENYSDLPAQMSAKFSAARIYEQQGKAADAIRYYEEVSRSGSGSTLGQQAMLKAVELKATLPAPAAPAHPAFTTTPLSPVVPPSK